MDTATQNKIRKTLSTIHAKNQQAFKDKAVFADRPHLKIDAAHCGELARATAKRTLAYGGNAEVWKLKGQDHAFAVIGCPPEQFTVDFKTWKGIWIIDPWAKIVCKAPEYVDKLKDKMERWTSKGKLIVTRFYHDGRINLRKPLDPEWIKAIASDEKFPLVVPSSDNKNPWAYFSASLGDLKRSLPQENQSFLHHRYRNN